MINRIVHLLVVGWRSAFEIVLLTVVVYYGYLYFRGTRGAKVLTGLAIVFLALTLISTLLKLAVIGWIIRSFSVFLAIALVVIFQPELRRALAELGGHPIFSLTSEKREMVHDLAEAVTQLASKQFGALIAIERDTSIRVYEETGVQLEADFSVELLLTIFHPKTALHDGGVIVRNGRVAAAACIFPVSQRETLDRSLGLRHRAGLGLTEESDAVAIVVSEETGAISICHRRRIERDFTPETFRKRIGEILLQSSYDEETDSEKLAGEDHLTPPSDHALSVGRVRLRRAAPRLAQKTRKIFLFPTSGTFVEAKFAFAAIEFVGMHTAPPITAHLVRHDRMQHFVIQDVLEEPKRHEALIEPGIDTNDAIFFLDGPENKIFFRTFSVFAAPNHFVTAKTVTEMTRV